LQRKITVSNLGREMFLMLLWKEVVDPDLRDYIKTAMSKK
jgi:hypothetical protein